MVRASRGRGVDSCGLVVWLLLFGGDVKDGCGGWWAGCCWDWEGWADGWLWLGCWVAP